MAAHTTFVIPCHNAGRHLCLLLRSLLHQTDQDFELLLVDDASTDHSVALAREVAGARIRIESNEARLGLSSNWNRCTQGVRTEFFCIAHMDDVYRPTYLAEMVAELRGHPEAGMVHCRAEVLDEDDAVVESHVEQFKERFWQASHSWDPETQFPLLLRGNYIVCPSALYRTEAHRQVGTFREDMSFAVDWDYAFRMLLAGWHIRGVPTRLFAYRRHQRSASMSAQKKLLRYHEELEVLQCYRRAGIEAGWLPDRHKGSPALRRNVLYTAYEDLRRGDGQSARDKLQFLRDRSPEDWRHPTVRLFRAMMGLGSPGRSAMGAGLKLALLGSRSRGPGTADASS